MSEPDVKTRVRLKLRSAAARTAASGRSWNLALLLASAIERLVAERGARRGRGNPLDVLEELSEPIGRTPTSDVPDERRVRERRVNREEPPIGGDRREAITSGRAVPSG
jgi:hypothetical protein